MNTRERVSIYEDSPAWKAVFAEGHPDLNRYRAVRRRLPSPPRCTMCLAPFQGVGGLVMRKVLGITRNERNINFCNRCDSFVQATPGGAEVELTMVYVDIQGSTALSQEVDASTYDRWINERFRDPVVATLMTTHGFIMDLTGDAVFAVYPPGFSGSDHARLAIEAARELLGLARARGRADVLPFRTAVHTDRIRIGRGELSSVPDSASSIYGVRATGSGVNTVAILSKEGSSDEALVTERAWRSADLEEEPELREVRPAKLQEPLRVRVLRA